MRFYPYQTHEVTAVRKVKWDRLWHVMYKSRGKETWDRVTKALALKVARKSL